VKCGSTGGGHKFADSFPSLFQLSCLVSVASNCIMNFNLQQLEPPTQNESKLRDIWLSQHYLPTVTVSLELGLFSLLHKEKALTVEQISQFLKVGHRSLNAILAVLCGLGLLRQTMGKFSLTETARLYLLPQSPFYWGPILLSDPLPDLHKRLKAVVEQDTPWSGGAIKEWESGEVTEARARHFTQQMHSHSIAASLGAARNYDWSQTKRVLDVGGGSGCFSISIAQKYPSIRCTVAELPAVVPITKEYIAKFKVEDRVDTLPMNMFTDKWPTNYDAHFFSNIFHFCSIEECQKLANLSFKALPSGGKIHIHEILLRDTKDGDLTAACFSLLMLIHTKGKQFTAEELTEILTGAGFKNVTITDTYASYSIVTGTKP
jgi:uncharacterized protein YoaH (UPF0181 family)